MSRTATRPDTDDRWSPATGRHAFDEDAALTPIFHALSRGGWRGRQQGQPRRPEVDPIEEFRRDPLTAPIPITPAPLPIAPATVPDARGRHHRRRDPAST